VCARVCECARARLLMHASTGSTSSAPRECYWRSRGPPAPRRAPSLSAGAHAAPVPREGPRVVGARCCVPYTHARQARAQAGTTVKRVSAAGGRGGIRAYERDATAHTHTHSLVSVPWHASGVAGHAHLVCSSKVAQFLATTLATWASRAQDARAHTASCHVRTNSDASNTDALPLKSAYTACSQLAVRRAAVESCPRAHKQQWARGANATPAPYTRLRTGAATVGASRCPPTTRSCAAFPIGATASGPQQGHSVGATASGHSVGATTGPQCRGHSVGVTASGPQHAGAAKRTCAWDGVAAFCQHDHRHRSWKGLPSRSPPSLGSCHRAPQNRDAARQG
jgi:hypothetical protein